MEIHSCVQRGPARRQPDSPWRISETVARTNCRLRIAFNHDRGSICQHFGYALHNLVGVVAHGDDGIGSMLSGMLHHQFVRIFARLFAKLSVERNVSSDNGLEPRTERSQNASRADNNAAHDTDVA